MTGPAAPDEAEPPSAGRILFVDDDISAWESVSGKLVKIGYEVIGSAPGPDEVVAAIADNAPDLTILDLHLGEGVPDGIEVAKAIHRYDSSLPVMICTSSDSPENARRALESDAVTVYLTKRWLYTHPEDLATNIRNAIAGVKSFFIPVDTTTRARAVTARELEVLGCRLAGLPRRAIAQQLCISEGTVHSHLVHVRQKLGADSIEEAGRLATERGLIAGTEGTGTVPGGAGAG